MTGPDPSRDNATAQQERAAKRGHLLTIAKTEHWTADEPDWEWSITCLAPDLCGGWQECDEVFKHRLAVNRARREGRVLLDRPPACAGDDRNDDEELLIHGAWHTYRYCWGWTVPFNGCVVAAHDDVSDFVWEIAREHGPGEHEVADYWDDDSLCALDHLRTRPASDGSGPVDLLAALQRSINAAKQDRTDGAR